MLKFSLIFIIVHVSAGNNESIVIDHQQSIKTSTPLPTTHSEPMNFMKNDLLFLSELPLEQLLKVKKSLNEIQQVNRQSNVGSEIGVVEEEIMPLSSINEGIESRTFDDGVNLDVGNRRVLNNPTLQLMNQNLKQLGINR